MSSRSDKKLEDHQCLSEPAPTLLNFLINWKDSRRSRSLLSNCASNLGALAIVIACIANAPGEVYLIIAMTICVGHVFTDMLIDDLPAIKTFLSNILKKD